MSAKLGPATTQVIEVMTKAIKVEYGDRYDEARHERMAVGRIRMAFEEFELGNLYDPKGTTGPTKRADQWKNAWRDLESRLGEVIDQIELLKSMSPQEVSEGEVTYAYPEIRDGLSLCPPGWRRHVLLKAEKTLLPVHQSVQGQVDSIPEPPRGKPTKRQETGSLKPMKIKGYAEARRLLAPIRTGRVQLWGSREQREGIHGDVGDRVKDIDIARAMLEQPPLGFEGERVCVELTEKYLNPKDEEISPKVATQNLSKRITSALKHEEHS